MSPSLDLCYIKLILVTETFLFSNAFGRKVFGQAEENHEVWKAVGRLVGHESGELALHALCKTPVFAN